MPKAKNALRYVGQSRSVWTGWFNGVCMQGAFGYCVNAIQKRYIECMNPFCCKISECGGCWGARIFQVYKIGVQFGPHTTELKDKMFQPVEQTCVISCLPWQSGRGTRVLPAQKQAPTPVVMPQMQLPRQRFTQHKLCASDYECCERS